MDFLDTQDALSSYQPMERRLEIFKKILMPEHLQLFPAAYIF
mgnify:CR=1 FL=1